MDVYLDATFGWCRINPCKSNGLVPYTSPWTGFFHHTMHSEYSDNNIINATSNKEFIQSLETCVGLFVLSDYLKHYLRNRLTEYGYPDIPIQVLYHPTQTVGILRFIPTVLNANDKINIINIGAWLRNSYSVYALDLDYSRFQKFRLRGKLMDSYFPPSTNAKEIISMLTNKSNNFIHCLNKYISDNNLDYTSTELENIITKHLNSVTVINHLNNSEYDLMMSKYVVFVDFIDCSAANTIIECIARGNPIIVNRLPSIVEYLGEEYPLYFNKLSEVKDILTINNLNKACNYLKQPEIFEKITSERFVDDLYNSEITHKTKLHKYIEV